MKARWVAALVALAVTLGPPTGSAQQRGQEFYAAPDGRPDADGSKQHPWDLQTALNRQPSVQPGATIWLRGGTYAGSFTSRVTGQEGAYITIRAYAGERPILDNAATGPVKGAPLIVEGPYVTVWGLEVTSTNPARKVENNLRAEEDFRPTGISVFAPHTRLVNNVVHDTGNCIGHWGSATDSEIYGNVLYFCGWDGPTRGHGHGMYIQNTGGVKEIRDNIVYSPFGYGIHAYTSGGAIDDLHFRRNVIFQSGRPVVTNPDWVGGDFLVGGNKVAHRSVVEGNFTYTRGTNHLGYIAGVQDAKVTGNYFVHDKDGMALTIVLPRNVDLSGNTFVGGVTDAGRYAENRLESKPEGIWQFVLPNAYDPARATVVIYNWDGAETVAVDAGSFLSPGDTYRIRSVENYFGEAVTATYSGGPVVVRMAPGPVAVPLGWQAPPSRLPRFGVFVLIKESHARG